MTDLSVLVIQWSFTCWITLTRSLRTCLRFLTSLLVMTAVVRYRRMCGHMVCIAFRYLRTHTKYKIKLFSLLRSSEALYPTHNNPFTEIPNCVSGTSATNRTWMIPANKQPGCVICLFRVSETVICLFKQKHPELYIHFNKYAKCSWWAIKPVWRNAILYQAV